MTSPLDTYLRDHLSNYIDETARLCAQPSVSARKEGIRECAALVREMLTAHGLEVQTFETPGSPVLVGRAAGASTRTLLFYNHYDVQPPEPLELWTTPPYAPTVRDGALYARGAKDDKGELVARLAALDAVRAAHGGALPCGVTFVVEGEEEIGSPHIATFVLEHLDLLRCDGSIWEEGGTDKDGRPGTSLGRRGVLGLELGVTTLARDAHSGNAHALPNAAWRLLRALATLKGPDERILIPGFYDRVLPPTPLDLELLDALPDREDWLREEFGVAEFVGGLHGKDLDRAVFNPTCNIQGLTAGYQDAGMKTVIPARATAKLDFRLVPDQDPDDIFARLRAHLDAQGFADVTLTRFGAMWPDKAAADHPFVALTARTAEEVYGQPYQLMPLVGGSSPVYAFARPLGNIPVVAAGIGRGITNRTHSPDEHVRLDDFLDGARHIARILDGFAQI
jgi:acetylornithine deacetylase/succinyl-diaminopimelate desuccinylase-like protein